MGVVIKLVYCITKKAGLSDDQFVHYWRTIHGPLGARIPGLRRLVQSQRVSVSGDRRAADYDGVAELWFDDIAALLRARQSPEWKAASDDEANFIEGGKVAYLVTQEHIVLERAK